MISTSIRSFVRRSRSNRRHGGFPSIYGIYVVLTALVLFSQPLAATQLQNASPDAPASQTGPDGPEAGSLLRVWLVTAAPGDAVWERYGHNAIRVLDTATGRDVSYNWGLFDFQQTDFIPRFLQGRMLYMMAPFPTRAMLDSYARTNREVVLQELNLTPAQKVALRDAAELNALPENREYFYQYFLDNCSTRVRDMLDFALGGLLRERFEGEATGTSYRYHTRRLTRVDPLIYTGMDLLLGTATDQPISMWEEMFVPMTLRDEIRGIEIVTPDGRTEPLVLSDEIVVASTRPADPMTPPRWFPIYVVIGLLLAAAIASAAHPRVQKSAVLRRLVLGITISWTTLAGILGTILVLLLFTDHTFAYRNENLVLFHPGVLLLGPLMIAGTRSERWRRRAAGLSTVILVVACAGLTFQLLPLSTHSNAIFFALALPSYLALALVVLTPRRQVPTPTPGPE